MANFNVDNANDFEKPKLPQDIVDRIEKEAREMKQYWLAGAPSEAIISILVFGMTAEALRWLEEIIHVGKLKDYYFDKGEEMKKVIQFKDENLDKLQSDLTALRSVADRMAEALEELCNLFDDPDYKKDSLTTQPGRTILTEFRALTEK